MVQGTPHRLAAAAVGVFLGDGDDEAQVRLHHLLLGLARLALALLHHLFDIRLSSRATAVPLGEPHQAAFVADQALVDVVELLDQRVDARLIEPQRLHLADDVVLELLVAASRAGESESLRSLFWMSWSCSRRQGLVAAALFPRFSPSKWH